MGIAERRDRQRVEREQRIITTARSIAEREGWAAVTMRRLAQEIEYSQPVLYSHFDSRDAIISAVALHGFRDLIAALYRAKRESAGRGDVARDVATAYLDFARDRPALYEAMFTLPTRLRFAAADASPELKEAFAALATVIPPSSPNSQLATEVLWSTLHGIAELERSGRIRACARDERVAFVAQRLFDA